MNAAAAISYLGEDTPAKVFRQRCRTWADQPALRHKQRGLWQSTTWAQYFARARATGLAMQALGLERGQVICVLAENRPEWLYVDMGAQCMGLVGNGVYPTSSAGQLQHILMDSDSRLLFVENQEQLDKALEIRTQCPQLQRIVVMDREGLRGFSDPDVEFFDEFLARGLALADTRQALFEASIDGTQAEDLAFLVYTSGTTGMPKGVMHSYRNFQEAFRIILTQFSFLHQEVFLSYLPLCHVAERMIISAAGVYLTGRVHFVQSLETFATDLERAQPTVFLAVPRIWEKFGETLHRKLPAAWLRRALAPVLRKKLGLSRARLVLSGAAPIRASLIDEFASLGIVIQEVYGMTENLGITTVNFRGKVRIGSVGQPFAGTRVTLGEGDEILLESPTNTQGYYREPELTAKLFHGGALHTGDVGRFDADGYLYITGRIKDIFKTAKGKYVAPAPIEGRIMEADEVEQVCLFGVNLPQPVALAVLTEHALTQAREVVESRLQQLLDAINRELPQHERLAQLIVVRERWEVDNGFITPSLKIKRNQVEKFYHDLVHGLVARAEKVVWA